MISCGFGGNFNRRNSPPYWSYYPHRYFFKQSYLYDFENNSYKKIADFPGNARQSGASISVNNEIFCWGGFSYSPAKKLTKKKLNSKKSNPYNYSDGYKLSNINGKYTWTKLPNLPFSLSFASICYYEDYIYIFGGADYDDSSFFTFTNSTGTIKNFGSMLWRINIKNLDNGWKLLSINTKCTPRAASGFEVVNDKLYVIGGFSGRQFRCSFYSCVDNWVYNIKENKWSSIAKPPNSVSGFTTHLYRDRYIFMVGGATSDGSINNKGYRNIIDKDKNISDNYGIIRQKFQKILLDNYGKKHYIKNNIFNRGSIVIGQKIKNVNDKLSVKPVMSNDILVYDTKIDKFFNINNKNGNSPIPVNINLPNITIKDEVLYIFGGEIDMSLVENEMYVGCSDIVLSGKIKDIASK